MALIVALATPARGQDSAFPQAPRANAVVVAPSDRIFADGFELFTLTINNYLAWCSVSVNGGAASSAATISQAFPPGTLVPLHGDAANASFVWGYWTGTDAGGHRHQQGCHGDDVFRSQRAGLLSNRREYDLPLKDGQATHFDSLA